MCIEPWAVLLRYVSVKTSGQSRGVHLEIFLVCVLFRPSTETKEALHYWQQRANFGTIPRPSPFCWQRLCQRYCELQSNLLWETVTELRWHADNFAVRECDSAAVSCYLETVKELMWVAKPVAWGNTTKPGMDSYRFTARDAEVRLVHHGTVEWPISEIFTGQKVYREPKLMLHPVQKKSSCERRIWKPFNQQTEAAAPWEKQLRSGLIGESGARTLWKDNITVQKAEGDRHPARGRPDGWPTRGNFLWTRGCWHSGHEDHFAWDCLHEPGNCWLEECKLNLPVVEGKTAGEDYPLAGGLVREYPVITASLNGLNFEFLIDAGSQVITTSKKKMI